MDLGLSGDVALVTGGAGRLGRAICTALAREGARVAVVDRRKDAAREVADEVAAQLRAADARATSRQAASGQAAGGRAATGQAAGARGAGVRAAAVEADVSVAASVAAMLDEVTRALGPVDVLVNAHGIYPNVPLLEMAAAEWDAVYATNTRGTMLTCQAIGKQMVERGAAGAIVNISSAAAESARAGGAAYCGSKAAVNLLTHVLAIELGPHGIRVNAVAPGLVLDEVYRPGDQHEFAYVTQSLQGTPMQRTGSPEDIAEAVVFLAGRNNPWITGSILPVTGGSHCGRTHVPLSRGLR